MMHFIPIQINPNLYLLSFVWSFLEHRQRPTRKNTTPKPQTPRPFLRPFILANLDLLVRCLEKVKNILPKWWFNGDLPLYKIKTHPKTSPRNQTKQINQTNQTNQTKLTHQSKTTKPTFLNKQSSFANKSNSTIKVPTSIVTVWHETTFS